MINLENQLKKEGYLTKSHEIKDFWAFITVPENLETVLEDGTVLMIEIVHWTFLIIPYNINNILPLHTMYNACPLAYIFLSEIGKFGVP